MHHDDQDHYTEDANRHFDWEEQLREQRRDRARHDQSAADDEGYRQWGFIELLIVVALIVAVLHKISCWFPLI